MKALKLIIFFLLCAIGLNAQSFYRPWSSYEPIKPKYPYKYIDTLNTELRKNTCYYKGNYYEPNEIITNLDITNDSVFNFFKTCCQSHPSKCVSNYIGKNNQTLLYTMVEKEAYRYMEWILYEGFAYDSNIDDWGVYREMDNGSIIPVRNYNPMMLACKKSDLQAAKILRKRGAYLSSPKNAIDLTPYDFASKYRKTASSDFLEYIQKEYLEEIRNLDNRKQFGKYFDLGLIDGLKYELEKNLFEYQQRIINKINELNKA